MKPEKILKRYGRSGDNLLAILHDIQDASPEHYLSDADLRSAADYLRLPYSFVHGVASFYTMYSLKPRGRNLIRVCQSPPCHLLGSSTISRELIKVLGVGFGETTADRLFTLEMTSCLGVCGVAPAMMVNDRVYGNLTAERIAGIIDDLRRAQ
ncbi:MAG TPA: NAD(P)H-dependent oxidoreductase subunit E [Candidatus Aminicenantes bacterium]|nr:NAD(P)H-dependent oxidoreductase subunit E [Candidatus Aminicenantes bacterium]